jgi:glycine/D-amino acid oxidase-like deaminating enzyme
MNGAQVIEKCAVTGIGTQKNEFGVNHVTHVDTTAGRVQTNCVVNATGVWAPYIGAMAGVSVPLVAMHHSYIVTERIEGKFCLFRLFPSLYHFKIMTEVVFEHFFPVPRNSEHAEHA